MIKIQTESVVTEKPEEQVQEKLAETFVATETQSKTIALETEQSETLGSKDNDVEDTEEEEEAEKEDEGDEEQAIEEDRPITSVVATAKLKGKAFVT